MGGVAVIAQQAGHVVSGSDEHVYPPMSTQLEALGVELMQGYEPKHLESAPDQVIVGNVMSRGKPVVEHLLASGLPYISGPQWLAEHVLKDRWVIAVSGTHGKTSTSSMVAWILEYAGLKPGFLIGGVPENFGLSARLGEGKHFVIEADEYDSAFFDKRSKFVHYHPRTLILNNLEFDHADIFPDLAAIQRQFRHLLATVPGTGLLLCPAVDEHLDAVLEQGVWTPIQRFGANERGQPAWQARDIAADGSAFRVYYQDQLAGKVQWGLLGLHNVNNALAAMGAAHHAGVSLEQGVAALCAFKNVKRRMEIKGQIGNITIYDDFAHHPTAIATVLQGLRAKVGQRAKIIVALEFGSFTMRSGWHDDGALVDALGVADAVALLKTEGRGSEHWDANRFVEALAGRHEFAALFDSVDEMVEGFLGAGGWARNTDLPVHIITMSSHGFGGIHQRLLDYKLAACAS